MVATLNWNKVVRNTRGPLYILTAYLITWYSGAWESQYRIQSNVTGRDQTTPDMWSGPLIGQIKDDPTDIFHLWPLILEKGVGVRSIYRYTLHPLRPN